MLKGISPWCELYFECDSKRFYTVKDIDRNILKDVSEAIYDDMKKDIVC